MKLTKVAFLDRDGVINSNKPNNGYIGSLEYFKWVQGAKKAIKFLNSNKYKVIIVSNQSGVARGFFKVTDIRKIHFYIQTKLKEINAKIDAFYFCPFHKDGIIKKYKKDSPLRKPRIGMFRLIQKRWKIDKKSSFMIGDQLTDMQFANNIGIKGFLFKGGNLLSFCKKIKIKIS